MLVLLLLNPLAEKVANNKELNINNTNKIIVNLEIGVVVVLFDIIWALPFDALIPLKESLSVCCNKTNKIIRTDKTIWNINKKLCKEFILNP